MAFAPVGVIYERIWPAYIIKSHAIYTESSVGEFNNINRSCKPRYYPITLWFIKCAIILVVAMHTILLFRSYDLLNCIITLLIIKFPI